MASNSTVFFCKECGYESAKWLGKCPSCNNWNSFVEEKVVKESKKSKSFLGEKSEIKNLQDIKLEQTIRIDTGFEELNRVFGNGLVKGSISLIGGEPGIGKSTLIMQISNNLSKHGAVLYVSGEESESQVKLRSERLKVVSNNIFFLNETNIDEIENKIEQVKPGFCIIDSIQTMYDENIPSTSGSVSQVKEVTSRLLYLAKRKDITMLVIGHVTKDGNIAGPRVLEHMVDTVIYIEGERFFENRIVRTVKNRFGSTNEIGIFKMQDVGMIEVTNPSEIFVSSGGESLPGSSITAMLEGNSVIMLELQALTSHSYYNLPRRIGNGIDINRISMILAVLEKRGDINLGTNDIYVNVTGGIRINEPACDLAIAAAVISSYKNISISPSTLFLGEIALTGEIRSVNNAEKRINEASKLGYKKIYLANAQVSKIKKENYSIQIIPVKNIKELIHAITEEK